MHCRYYSKRNQMSADLKRVTHELRTSRSDRLKKTKLPVYRYNRAGDAIPSGVVMDVLSTPMSPRARHTLAWDKE